MNGHSDASSRSDRVSRRRVLAAAGTLGAGLLAGCSGGGGGSGGSGDGNGDSGSDGDGGDGSGGGSGTSWRTTELTDVRTDETFTIDGLEGPVAIQSFAVWCPKCERQSQELSETDESVTVVSLNTDPNEDAEKVRQHAESNGFDWRFAVAPTEMTESLVGEFGTTVTNAPSTPIIVACGEGVAEFFSGSQQSVEDIQAAASEC
jgi:thiol-disulfide isomerase/thioredoxin